MKILSAKQARETDAYTIKNEPIDSVDLMERASRQLYYWFIKNIDSRARVVVFCGNGNNGGDGLALSRMLLMAGRKVKTVVVNHSKNQTKDFKINLERLMSIKSDITYITETVKEDLDVDVIVDALLGSGLNAPLKGVLANVVQVLNNTKAIKVTVDISTGLLAENHDISLMNNVFEADYTLTFQSPKLSMMLPDSGKYCGKIEVLDIGLDQEFIKNNKSRYCFISEVNIKEILQKKNKFDYKGNNGHALIIGGSKGKIGAAILASKSCLKAGVGLVTAYVPMCGLNPFQSALPEVMVKTSNQDDVIDDLIIDVEYNAIGIGPGIGVSELVKNSLFKFLGSIHTPVVLDADALNIISAHDAWDLVPNNSILTPHIGEFKRMVPNVKDNFVKHASEFATDKDLIVVLKGAHTAVCLSSGKVFFNSTGNQGMATAGSGDVLSGIITSFLAQGYTTENATLLGVYIHGLSGDFALNNNTFETVTAQDIIDNLYGSFQKLRIDKKGLI